MMRICNSYQTALKRNVELSKNHDKTVLEWKKQHEIEHKEMVNKSLNPRDVHHLANFRKENSTPIEYQVTMLH